MTGQTVNTVLAVSAGAVAGGIKLVFVGACLALGFSLTNLVVRKSADAYVGWKYARLERKHPEPKDEDDANTS